MKHLKLFESYYEDLTPYAYGRIHGKECLNVGWIGSEENFTTGEVSEEFIKKLEAVERSDEYTSERHKGFHRCELCGVLMGSQVKKIEYNGKCYKFPSKVSHYVRDHKYKPPQEFIDAIMSLEIKDQISKSYGGSGFIGGRYRGSRFK